MIKIVRTGKFERMVEELTKNHSELQFEVERLITLFRHNPDDTRLDNHPLTKSLEGKWAFSITNDIRIVYEWNGKNTVRFLAIGEHIQVYSPSKSRSN